MRTIMMVAAVLALAGCGVAASPQDRAEDQARDKARRVGNVLHSKDTPRDMGRRGAELNGVDVMAVTPDGVVVRVSGTAPTDMWASTTVTVRRCYELPLDAEWDATPDGVDCLGNAPLAFAPAPRPPDIPVQKIEDALPRVPEGGSADEAEVRAAVRKLDLDPEIKATYETRGRVVGIKFSTGHYPKLPRECALGRVGPKGTSVWMPPRIQRMPGEAGCPLGYAFGR